MHILLLFPKEGKDHTDPKNYRPISLLNVDLKIFTKIIASQLARWIPTIIHGDQDYPLREAKDRVTRVLDVIHAARDLKTPLMLLSMLKKHLTGNLTGCTGDSWGLITQHGTWIDSIYSNPTAKVKVNGILFEFFDIHKGTRQGCPHSPILFLISLESFLRRVRANNDIQGVTIRSVEPQKLSAYADYLLFFISNPLLTLPSLLREVQLYGNVSNYKLNLNKSEALNITLSDSLESTVKKNFRFYWY